jgi:hypothetical protein
LTQVLVALLVLDVVVPGHDVSPGTLLPLLGAILALLATMGIVHRQAGNGRCTSGNSSGSTAMASTSGIDEVAFASQAAAGAGIPSNGLSTGDPPGPPLGCFLVLR